MPYVMFMDAAFAVKELRVNDVTVVHLDITPFQNVRHAIVMGLGWPKTCAVQMVSVTAFPTSRAVSVTSVHQVFMAIQTVLGAGVHQRVHMELGDRKSVV